MRNSLILKVIVLQLIVTLVIVNVSPPLPYNTIKDVQASPFGINIVTGFFRTLSALNQRNRVYGEARVTAQEINAYYNERITKADEILQEMISKTASGEQNPALIRSYIRVKASLEQERQYGIQFIENEKNKARQQFNQRLANEIKRVLLASPSGQSILVRIRETIQATRHAAVAVQVAAGENKPSTMLNDALNDRLGDIQIIRNLAQELGSKVGSRIDRTLGGIITKFENALSGVENEMGQAISVLDSLDATVAHVQNQDANPVSTSGNNIIDNLIPTNSTNASYDVAAAVFAISAENSGALPPGETRQSMIDKIRNALLQETLNDLLSHVFDAEKGTFFCVVTNQASYDSACGQLGITPQQAKDPEKAVYLVCYDTQTKQVKFTRLLEQKFVFEEEPPEEPTVQEDEPLEPVTVSENQVAMTDVNVTIDQENDRKSISMHGSVCEEAEGNYNFTQQVDIFCDATTLECAGTMKYHNCPGGGRVLYHTTGQIQADGNNITLTGTKKDGGGGLYTASPDTRLFYIRINEGILEPIWP